MRRATCSKESNSSQSFSPHSLLVLFAGSTGRSILPPKKSSAMATRGKALERMPTLPEELPFDYLKKITKDFSAESQIGTDAFGSVNQGILDNGVKVSVLKLMENSPVPSKQAFANEAQNIMVLEHENIAKMVAYCREPNNKLVNYNGRYIIAEITETALCYEYAANGSLDNHIFGGSSVMDWDTRFEIIKGITRGIQYLHNLPDRVLHLNLNPGNIWLDDNMVPKIAHFGLSRIVGTGETRKNTSSHVGTLGYMAPEYVFKGEISARSDIYSLGLIILEIATRQENSLVKGKNDATASTKRDANEYIEKIKETWTPKKILRVYHDLDKEGINQVQTCIRIGLQCADADQEKRPDINEIVKQLN